MKKMYIIIVIILVIIGAIYFYNHSSSKAAKYFSDSKVAVLASAANNGDVDGVTKAIENGANPNAVGNSAGITPLLYVMSMSKNLNGIRALLQNGANPNYVSPDGISPMLIAAQGDDQEFLKAILDNGGNPNLLNRDKESATYLAARQHRCGNIKILLDHGADINAIGDQSGYTLLMEVGMMSVSHDDIINDYNCSIMLIERGADVKAMADNGHTIAKIIQQRNTRGFNEEELQLRAKVIQLLRDRGVEMPDISIPK